MSFFMNEAHSSQKDPPSFLGVFYIEHLLVRLVLK
jgi:hypothetical protein